MLQLQRYLRFIFNEVKSTVSSLHRVQNQAKLNFTGIFFPANILDRVAQPMANALFNISHEEESINIL